MGCCQSNASRDEAANAQPVQAIAQGYNGSSQAAAIPNHPRARVGNGANRPNQRIRNPSPVARSPKNVSRLPPPWTRSHLEKERQDFFDTRVNGSVEIWAAMRQVCELLRLGDLAGAQAILDALNMSCPSGKFSRGRGRDRGNGGVYDERGELYDIPNWVVVDPRDIVEDNDDKIGIDVADDSDDPLEGDEDSARKREEKGKGRAIDLGEEMKVRVRFSDGTADLEITFGAKQNAGVVVKKILEQRGEKVTLLHLGKKIDEKQTLEAQGWHNGTVLNAFLHLKEVPPKVV